MIITPRIVGSEQPQPSRPRAEAPDRDAVMVAVVCSPPTAWPKPVHSIWLCPGFQTTSEEGWTEVGACQPGWSLPVSPTRLTGDHPFPATKMAKRGSWHTFRRSYATVLKRNDEDVRTV
jgi:hypothetical protein